jgi:hypothetical protein
MYLLLTTASPTFFLKKKAVCHINKGTPKGDMGCQGLANLPESLQAQPWHKVHLSVPYCHTACNRLTFDEGRMMYSVLVKATNSKHNNNIKPGILEAFHMCEARIAVVRRIYVQTNDEWASCNS